VDRDGVDPLTANRAHVARFVRELRERPSRHLADKFNRGMQQLHGWRVQLLAELAAAASTAITP
jgi:hypothetical protein